MMRSPQPRRPSLARSALDNLFLCLAGLAGLAFGLIHILELGPGDPLFAVLQSVWTILGFGFRWVAGVVASQLPGLPDMLAIALIVLLGLMLYLLADALLRRLRP